MALGNILDTDLLSSDSWVCGTATWGAISGSHPSVLLQESFQECPDPISRSKHPWLQCFRFMGSLKISFSASPVITYLLSLEKTCIPKIQEAYLGGQGSRLQAFSSCGGRRLVTHSVSSAVSLVCLFRQVTTASWTPAHKNTWSQPALCTWRGSHGQQWGSGAALGLWHAGEHSLTPSAASSGSAALLQRERRLLPTCQWSVCCLHLSALPGGLLRVWYECLPKGDVSRHSVPDCGKLHLLFCLLISNSYNFCTLLTALFCILFLRQLGYHLIKTLWEILGFYLSLLSVSPGVSIAMKSP